MNTGQVLNIMSCKLSGKGSLNGKNINMGDFRKLISGLFSGKEEKTEGEIKSDMLNILISQLASGNFAENGVNLNEIKALDTDNILSMISDINMDELKLLLSKSQITADNKSNAYGDDRKFTLSESLNIPEISDKPVLVKELKTKLMELASKIESSNKDKVNETAKLEDYGEFKKSVLFSKRNELNPIKEETGIIQSKTPEKVSVKTDSLAGFKKENDKTEVIKPEDSSENVFSSMINKIDMKNTSLKGEAELPVISKENLNGDVIKTVSFMKEQDIKNLTVKVTPKELGEITIELIFSGDKISAKLTSSTNSTFQLLDQNAAALNSELSKNGINLQNVSVNLYSGNFSGNDGNQGQEYKRREEKKQVQEIEQDETIDDSGNINIFA